ncbi:uncharacterized protein UBRO_00773 [Ustilago bromivora]|uniref:Uncharacterized protein n=1 Tax=Ustilago bromivora TaxID=307758 RepID=A0A1K0GIP2_9BASI|nr:uncharacterized protein UBRO_00773 [Ustilago bromivora]SYW79237.1 uncharacterized protein UBRO2_02921 [Ustilago bromivora]
MAGITLESPPPIIASSSSSRTSAPSSPPLRANIHQPIMMELSTSTSTGSIDSSCFQDQPSSRRLFHNTPTAPHSSANVPNFVSPVASSSLQSQVRTSTASGVLDDQDVFGKIDHTPLRQETHSTSPLPNSRSLQMGDMLDHVLPADQSASLSVGNIIAPERGSSKKQPPKRLPTDPHSTTASPTPLSRSSVRPRSALTSITLNKSMNAAREAEGSSSPASDPFSQRSYLSADELSFHVKHQMAALQESPQTC